MREEDNPVVRGKLWSKVNGGTNTTAEAIIDSGSTHPITTMPVTNAMKVEITPLTKELTIIEASGKSLAMLGTVRRYLESEVLGGRKIIKQK